MDNLSQAQTHDLTKKIENLSEATLNKVDETVSNVQSNAKEYSKSIEKYIQKNPIESIGIAVAAGVLLALFLKK